jgi:hypothetical protein
LVKSRISEDFSSLDESESSDSLISQLLALEENYFPTPASDVQTQNEDQPSLLSKKPMLAVAPEHGDKSTTTTTARLSESDAEDEILPLDESALYALTNAKDEEDLDTLRIIFSMTYLNLSKLLSLPSAGGEEDLQASSTNVF